MKKTIFVILCIFYCIPKSALAHPGHGHKEWEYSLIHFLVEPVHWAVGVALTACIAVTIVYYTQRKLKAKQ